MSVRVRDSGGVSVIARVRARDASNTLSSCRGFRVRDSGGLFSVFATLSASGPATAEGFGYSIKPISITTNTITVSVSGGIGPYTHSWAVTGSVPWSATNPTSGTTAFRAVAGAGLTQSGTAIDTITDATGATTTFTVTPSVTNNSGA